MSEGMILSKEEFVARAGLTDEEMGRWLKLGLLVPAGRTAGKAPLFSTAQLDLVGTIKSLRGLGYDEDKISRIVRKVGLPTHEGARKGTTELLRTVGELAQECDVNPRTIKHWEEKELLEPDARSEGGFRLYGPMVVARCKRIIDLQNIGYTLEEMKSVGGLLDEPETLLEAFKADPSPDMLERADTQSASLKDRLDRVTASAKRLEDLLKRRTKAIASCRSLLGKLQKARKEEP